MTGRALEVVAVGRQAQPWLASPAIELAFIMAPAFLSSGAVLLFRNQIAGVPDLPLWGWVCFVLLIDVAHVYATLFRTYFNREALSKHSLLLTVVPLACWLGGCLLYSMSEILFWRTLAYLAVFHFVRQQYGLVVLYSRKDPDVARQWRFIDCAVVYAATIYPLLFWHTNLPRGFNWFVPGDFARGLPEWTAVVGLGFYLSVGIAYLAKETWLAVTAGFVNVPRNLLILGTALSWWVGIVAMNSDFAFTVTNVVSHGIPYMALVWLYHRQNGGAGGTPALPGRNAASGDEGMGAHACGVLRVMRFAPLFLLVLALLAYLEEGLWDGLIWHEHGTIFGAFSHLPALTDPCLLALVVPLLALPQSAHYVLDGFIWRVKDRRSSWSA